MHEYDNGSLDEQAYMRWRSKRIRLLYRWALFNLALALLSVALSVRLILVGG